MVQSEVCLHNLWDVAGSSAPGTDGHRTNGNVPCKFGLQGGAGAPSPPTTQFPQVLLVVIRSQTVFGAVVHWVEAMHWGFTCRQRAWLALQAALLAQKST